MALVHRLRSVTSARSWQRPAARGRGRRIHVVCRPTTPDRLASRSDHHPVIRCPTAMRARCQSPGCSTAPTSRRPLRLPAPANPLPGCRPPRFAAAPVDQIDCARDADVRFPARRSRRHRVGPSTVRAPQWARVPRNRLLLETRHRDHGGFPDRQSHLAVRRCHRKPLPLGGAPRGLKTVGRPRWKHHPNRGLATLPDSSGRSWPKWSRGHRRGPHRTSERCPSPPPPRAPRPTRRFALSTSRIAASCSSQQPFA